MRSALCAPQGGLKKTRIRKRIICMKRRFLIILLSSGNGNNLYAWSWRFGRDSQEKIEI